MVIVLHHHISETEKQEITDFLSSHGYRIREIEGSEETIIGAVGSPRLDIRDVEVLPGVARVIPISKPYKLASRELNPQDSIVEVGPVRFGAGRVVVIAGPCAVENREQLMTAASQVREGGAAILRGGAFKPRTSPYSFQGLGEEGLKLLQEAGKEFGMPVVSEMVSPTQVDLMKEYVDMIQIGARNMQNFELLKAAGASGVPVLLKRGLSARIEEWLMAAEYVMAQGNDSVVLCERGIRTFETETRNSLDLSSIPVVKKLSHLPVIVDPSHATGIRDSVLPMAMASVAGGADGIIVEVHPDPEKALSDGAQSLFPQQFYKLVGDIHALTPVFHRELFRLPSFKVGTESKSEKRQNPNESSSELTSESIKIAYQGAAGAYSEMALERYLERIMPGQKHQNVPLKEFEDVFESVLLGNSELGVLPIENALTGSIHENYDLLIQYPDIIISGEIRIRIQHSLIGLPGTKLEDIRQVFSHPQGLAQCSNFLESLDSVEQKPFYDTAGAVAFVAEQQKKEYAAIAGSLAASAHGLEILKEGIETNPVNYTRFVVIRRRTAEEAQGFTNELLTMNSENQGDLQQNGSLPNSGLQASIVFSVHDKPGALLKCMETLGSRNLNLSKIESRPIHGKPWEYMFYLDVDISGKIAEFKEALNGMVEYARDIRILGCYSRN